MKKTLDLSGKRSLKAFPKLASTLEEVDANSTSIEDLAPLSALQALRVLKLRGTKVTSIAPLLGCRSLAFVYLERSRVDSLEGIGKLRKLELLWLHDTRVTDGSPLARATSLVELDLANLELPDFSFISRLRKLETLDLFRTGFEDVALLEKLPRLRRVRLAETRVAPNSPAAMRLAEKLSKRGGGLSFDASSRWMSRLRAPAPTAKRSGAEPRTRTAASPEKTTLRASRGPLVFALGAGKYIALAVRGSALITLSLAKRGASGYQLRATTTRARDEEAARAALTAKAAVWAKKSSGSVDASARRVLLARLRTM
ncbi:MAG: hypothetical protein U0414_02665 [Polyangiaceae bacterium]